MTLDAVDPENEPMYFSLLIGPTNMTVNATSGLVDFTPTAAGTRVATLQVTAAKGGNPSAALNALGLPFIEILPCSNADGSVVGGVDGEYGTCTPLDATLGTDFGQVPLGVLDASNILNQEKIFVVRVRGSNAANFKNTLSLSLTTSTSPADFSVASPLTCNSAWL